MERIGHFATTSCKSGKRTRAHCFFMPINCVAKCPDPSYKSIHYDLIFSNRFTDFNMEWCTNV